MIDRATIERIKDRADIVDVVSEFVSLKKVGANYRGLCPFHDDHSPSFYVSPSRRTCHCFVCGEGGDSVGFIMKHEQLTYPDALKWLANRYHIEIEETQLTDEQRKADSEREAMFIVNEWAANHYHDILRNDIDGRAIGMQYFRQRGIREDIIEKFKLGFCLASGSDTADSAKKKGYKDEYLIKTGLCYQKDNGGLRDRFAGRVMFPWIGVSGKVVAFGGRVLDSRTKGVNQKYVNSPDSDIYHKDHELYGIFQAKKAIAKEHCVYMVEGYTDVISMHQCGIENVVANSGTALSPHQVHILHRFTPNIVLLYDGDKAGIKAALRSTDILLEHGMNVKILLLPDGDDPDSFAKKHNAEEFRAYIKEHQADFIVFKIQLLLDGVTDPRERSEAISSIVKSISVIGDQVVRMTYIQECASRLGIDERVLIAKMNEYIREYREEKRKIEARQQRTSALQQDYNSTGQQPILPGAQTGAQASAQSAVQPASSAPVSQPGATNTSPYNGDPRYEDYPPEAFLPPEAFSQPPAGVSGGASSFVAPQQSSPTTVQTSAVPKVSAPSETLEDIIISMVIKHGEKVIYDNVETEDGGTVSLTLAQFLQYDLANDALMFTVPLYNRILDEAVQHSTEEDFVAEKYFTMHPDYEISSLSLRLTSEKVLLSKSMQMTYSEEMLRNQIIHLLLELRQKIISTELENLYSSLRATIDAEKRKEIMQEIAEKNKIRLVISKRIGVAVVARK